MNSSDVREWDSEMFREYLENGALFSKIVFTGNIPVSYFLQRSVIEISAYCPKCKKIQLFQSRYSTSGFSGVNNSPPDPVEEIIECHFHCVKAKCQEDKRIWVWYHRDIIDGKIRKVTLCKCGEWPSMSPRIEKAVLDVFPDDAELLKKAVSCLREGYGVGAFAYLRQVLEPHINQLLEEIEYSANAQGDSNVLEKLGELRRESQMSNKIAIAKEALPQFLQVNGINPLGLLYKNLSEGIHGGTDEECLKYANSIYTALCFILKTIASTRKDRQEYVAALKTIQ